MEDKGVTRLPFPISSCRLPKRNLLLKELIVQHLRHFILSANPFRESYLFEPTAFELPLVQHFFKSRAWSVQLAVEASSNWS